MNYEIWLLKIPIIFIPLYISILLVFKPTQGILIDFSIQNIVSLNDFQLHPLDSPKDTSPSHSGSLRRDGEKDLNGNPAAFLFCAMPRNDRKTFSHKRHRFGPGWMMRVHIGKDHRLRLLVPGSSSRAERHGATALRDRINVFTFPKLKPSLRHSTAISSSEAHPSMHKASTSRSSRFLRNLGAKGFSPRSLPRKPPSRSTPSFPWR